MNERSFRSAIIPSDPNKLDAEIARRCSMFPLDEREMWAHKLLYRYRDSDKADEKALELAIRSTARPGELQDFLFALYCRHFINAHATLLRDFREFCRGAQLLVLHVSCQARQHLASASVESFGKGLDGVRHLIIVGQSAKLQPCGYAFDLLQGVLTVPALDNYEGLVWKVAMLYRLLGFSGNVSCVMKVDDDIRRASKFVAQDLIALAQRHHYVGCVIAGADGIHRCWHFDKCENAELNQLPYSMPADCNYADGPAYLLSPDAVNVLARASIYFCQLFKSEFYEDLAVGKVLRVFGLNPYNYDLVETGALAFEGFKGFQEHGASQLDDKRY